MTALQALQRLLATGRFEQPQLAARFSQQIRVALEQATNQSAGDSEALAAAQSRLDVVLLTVANLSAQVEALEAQLQAQAPAETTAAEEVAEPAPKRRRRRRKKAVDEPTGD